MSGFNYKPNVTVNQLNNAISGVLPIDGSKPMTGQIADLAYQSKIVNAPSGGYTIGQHEFLGTLNHATPADPLNQVLLPSPSGIMGRVIRVVDVNGSAGVQPIRIRTDDQLIDGCSEITLNQNFGIIEFESVDTGWNVLGGQDSWIPADKLKNPLADRPPTPPFVYDDEFLGLSNQSPMSRNPPSNLNSKWTLWDEANSVAQFSKLEIQQLTNHIQAVVQTADQTIASWVQTKIENISTLSSGTSAGILFASGSSTDPCAMLCVRKSATPDSIDVSVDYFSDISTPDILKPSITKTIPASDNLYLQSLFSHNAIDFEPQFSYDGRQWTNLFDSPQLVISTNDTINIGLATFSQNPDQSLIIFPWIRMHLD